MSESKAPTGAAVRMRYRQVLKIRRDDHIGDSIGVLFLDASDGAQDAALARLGEYLGRKVTILKAELGSDEIELEIECRVWREEAGRLAVAARDLHGKGARRNAVALYREALAMDPFNEAALCGLGLALASNSEWKDAAKVLKLAREVGGDGVDVLAALGRCYVRLDRIPAARAVFEKVLQIDSRNFTARRELRRLDSGRRGRGDGSTGPA
jgi:tetratricopeptide (TPR) repeat protein